MEPRTGRKRPWEDDSPIDMQVKRRGSNFGAPGASPSWPSSPLPHEAGHYSRDNRILNLRRLPPPRTSPRNTLAETTTFHPVQVSTSADRPLRLENPRPRSQSLFDVFRQPGGQDHEHYAERPVDLGGTLDSEASPLIIGTDLHRSRFGTGLAPHAAGASICCPSNCEGQACLNTRTLMHKLATGLALLQHRVEVVTHIAHRSTDPLPTAEHPTAFEALEWALDLVERSNFKLQEHSTRSSLRSPDELSQPDNPSTMRRNQHHLEEREEQSPPSRTHPSFHHGHSGFAHPTMLTEDSRRLPYHGGEMNSVGNSPHPASSPGSAFMPPQSPLQAPQPMRSTILPSPSSLNFPIAPTLPSISSPSATGQTSAQSAHLQDLQHQVSVKTLAFQTLQREYDSLLQKLERQRTKCATLEKKFEVSDVEINSLTDEKEKLHAQVAALECQVEDLQQSRDEARRQLVANGAQYMQIVEMANKLQGKGAEDKKKWEAEKFDLDQRIRLLEEAMVAGADQTPSEAENLSSASPPASSTVLSQKSVTPSASQSETINVLRAEVGRLRSRTQNLETALQTMRQESVSIQEAARQLVQSSDKIEDVAQSAMALGR